MADRQLSWDDKQRLCEALLKIRGMHDPDMRNLYVTELEQHLGQALSVQRYADARHDLISLISACQGYPNGVRSFIQIVHGFQPGSVAILDVERLIDELERAPLMTQTDREALHRLLSGVPSHRIAVAFNDVVEPASLQPQPNWHDVATVVRRIEQVPGADGGPAPLLVFIDRIAHAVERVRAIDLHRWIDRVGNALGMDQAALRNLCVETRHRLDEGQIPAETDDTSDTLPEKTNSSDKTASTAGVAVISTSPTTHSPPLTPSEQIETLRLWGGVPIRNPDFTGRDPLLRQLREALETKSKASVLPQTLHGLGGVGKTQLAVEYVYRYADRYDIVWWISAEETSLVLASLETLADRLGLPRSEHRRQTAATVRDALGTSRLRWLLVFDNADEPEEIAELVPSAGGHVILTSRNQAWSNVWDAVEVDVFDRHESVELVRKRGEGITERRRRPAGRQAGRPAARAGPGGLVAGRHRHAGLRIPALFDEHVQELLSEGKPASYHTTVAAFVSLAFDRLRTEAPAVAQLLEMFAFLGAEPISVALLQRGRKARPVRAAGPGAARPDPR